MKAGNPHVQPPVAVLQRMLTLRLYLDHTDESNGALGVLRGSHKHGRMEARDIQSWREGSKWATCNTSSQLFRIQLQGLFYIISERSNVYFIQTLNFYVF